MQEKLATTQIIENNIFIFRGNPVMVDRDLSELYQVEVKRLNEQVKRNIERFPSHFRFQLTDAETNELVANCDRFEKLKHSSSNPYVFTEQGVAMLSAVLRSDIAIAVSIQIITAFVEMRKVLTNNAGLLQRVESIMRKFAECWPDREFVPQTVAQIPWRSNITLMDKLHDPALRRCFSLLSKLGI